MCQFIACTEMQDTQQHNTRHNTEQNTEQNIQQNIQQNTIHHHTQMQKHNTSIVNSLFLTMPDFEKVSYRPFTSTEHKLKFLFSARSKLQQEQIDALLQDVRYIRYSKKTLALKQRTTDTSVVLSVFGFGSYIERDLFLRCFRYAFQPRLVFASEVRRDQWEAIYVLNCRNYSSHLTSKGCEHFVDCVQQFCDLFKLSISVLELPSWTDPATVTAIQRIQKGFRLYGNWENVGNNELRLEFELAQEYKAQALMNDDIRRATNMEFTTGNMQHLFHEVRNREIVNAQLVQDNVQLGNAANNSTQILQDIIRMLTQQAANLQHLHVATHVLRQGSNETQQQNANALEQFHSLVQNVQQQNQVMTSILNNIIRHLRASFTRHGRESRASRQRRPSTNATHTTASNADGSVTPVYDTGHAEQTAYSSPPLAPYPASPPPNLTQTVEVIDLTQDDPQPHTSTSDNSDNTINLIRQNTRRMRTQPVVAAAIPPPPPPPATAPPATLAFVSGAFVHINGTQLPTLWDNPALTSMMLRYREQYRDSPEGSQTMVD